MESPSPFDRILKGSSGGTTQEIIKALILGAGFSLILICPLALGASSVGASRIQAVVERMDAAFKAIEDYTCEVEQVFYREGKEDQRSRSRFYFKKNKKIRVDFFHPHPALSLFYQGESEVTILPFRTVPALKFRLSIGNSLVRSAAGQRIDQTDMGYFISFLLKNLERNRGEDGEFQEDEEEIRFLFRAMDYIEEKHPERYRISVSKKHWLPVHIERYRLDGVPIETTEIRDYKINGLLEDRVFSP